MPDGGEDAAMPAMPPARWQDWCGTGDPPVAPDLAAYQSMQMRPQARPSGGKPSRREPGACGAEQEVGRTRGTRSAPHMWNKKCAAQACWRRSHSLSLGVSRTLQEDLA